ncbi:FAD-dependent oxidoreductase [Actinomadura macrotermitis]|uniref:ferredoxin--NADP(+) reductase n=1 Tax=Actinomadura macrotermitis TaxID=2585200 RepID=A0A7K0BRY4_9ACTN|nr:FAD-dependent oxidoreductase [Actinomadura macrotermitis]MQY03642.1 putative ferredoxin/ferredoxin--NADP reductase [Actinomadura macrotermitis]
MPHVVTQSCCGDASCVYACPVNCIHPTPDEPDFHTSDMLYIDPAACVDCGACVSACPVEAITPHTKLAPSELPFVQINADFYKDRGERPLLAPVTPPLPAPAGREPLRVAIVGSGPAAMYAADELLTVPGAQVNMFERLPVPYGLAWAGVAPDHRRTRQVTGLFDRMRQQVGFRLFTGVEVGSDLTHEDLLAHHHAVVYAVGASSDRRLAVPGHDLPGVATATEFVAWYNGHPGQAGARFDLSGPRVVVIGNGNVALDVARVLTTDPDALDGTDIARPALEALRAGGVEEVVIAARRGPAQSAFTLPELIGLIGNPHADLVVDPADLAAAGPEPDDHATAHKLRLLREVAGRPAPAPGRKRIVLRYFAAPVGVAGEERASGVELARTEPVPGDETRVRVTGESEVLETGLVLSSIGYRGVPVPGVPFDESAGIVPNRDGRVLDAPGGAPLPGVYATGWIKRGPTGFLGTNKTCAQETVRLLVQDLKEGRRALPDPAELARLVGSRRTAAAPV